MEDIRTFLDGLIETYVGTFVHGYVYTLIVLGCVIGFTIIVEVLMRLLFARSLPRLIDRVIKRKNGFVNKKIVGLVIRYVSVSIFLGLLPIAFPEDTNIIRQIIDVVTVVYLTILLVKIVGELLTLGRRWMLSSEKYRYTPFVNLFQIIYIIVISLAVLYIVSLLFGMEMKTLFGSLAALSAVMMLVFKDTLIGLVAGIQLSMNDVVRVGDWITSPKYGVDGDVMDISLTTVKVRSFDNAVYTIPPYALVSDTVINWRPMQSTGRRRCVRSLYIDIRSVHRAHMEMIESLSHSKTLGKYLSEVRKEIELENSKIDNADDLRKRHLTNIGLFRRYITAYLKGHPKVSKESTIMVRQLEHTEKGLPLQLYFFTDTSNWAEFEEICSDIFDHLYSVAYRFDINFFQNVTGTDIRIDLDDTNKEKAIEEPGNDTSPKD